MSFLDNTLSLIKGELEVSALPVVIGALQILQKSPDAAGVMAAEAYVLGNMPAALLTGATTLLQEQIMALSAKLAALQAAGTAAKPA